MKFFERLLAPKINKLESQGNIEALLKILESDDRTDFRVEAIEALARIGGDRVSQPLVDLLSDEDPSVVEAAETAVADLHPVPTVALEAALGGKGGDAALPILIGLEEEGVQLLANACKSQVDDARRRALDGLLELDGKLKSDDVRQVLFRALLASLGDRLPEGRVFAAKKLETINDPKASRGLAAQLKDGDENVRAACGDALRAIGEPAVPYLLDALSDRNLNSRKFAAKLLGEICSGNVEIRNRRIALVGLAERASDSDPEVSAAVHRALQIIPSDEVLASMIEDLRDPDRSDHEEIVEFLDQMIEFGQLGKGFKLEIARKMTELGFTPASDAS